MPLAAVPLASACRVCKGFGGGASELLAAGEGGGPERDEMGGAEEGAGAGGWLFAPKRDGGDEEALAGKRGCGSVLAIGTACSVRGRGGEEEELGGLEAEGRRRGMKWEGQQQQLLERCAPSGVDERQAF